MRKRLASLQSLNDRLASIEDRPEQKRLQIELKGEIYDFSQALLDQILERMPTPVLAGLLFIWGDDEEPNRPIDMNAEQWLIDELTRLVN